jgi:signal transduction histidine kinase
VEQKAPPSNVSVEGYTSEFYASLLAGLIHKLNNVITVLTGHSGLLLLEPDLTPDIVQPVQQMSRAADLLSQCLNEAASLSRVTTLRPESVTVSEILAGVETPEGLLIVKEYDERTKVHVDRRKSKEIFEQILQNAAEANAKAVYITAQAHSGTVELKFRDDGNGMKTEVLRRAFDPFFTTRRQREQFGLGLFKARGDVVRMKGRVSAESDGKSYTELILQLPTE